MTISIVIAKYCEDISWVDNLENNTKIYIYTKNGETYKDHIYTNIKLPNIGRESHTYLYHIINNYNNLTDIVIFTQGNYKDHINDINELYYKINDFYHMPYDHIKDFRLMNYGTDLVPNKDNFTVDQWLKHYNIETNPEKYIYKIKYGACFSTTKQNILSRPLSFYQELIKQLDTNNSEVGHFFERAWYFIFNVHKINIL